MKIQNFEYVEQASGMKMMHNHTILGFALALTPSSSSSLLLLSVFLDLSFVVIKKATWNRKSIFAEEVACPFEHFCGLLSSTFSIDVLKTTTWFLKNLPIFFCWIKWTLKYIDTAQIGKYIDTAQIGYRFFLSVNSHNFLLFGLLLCRKGLCIYWYNINLISNKWTS